MACRDGVEVRLPHILVRGIQTGENGEGVVVLRINGQSPLGPHRHRKTKEFYIRRNDETIPMTVEEIRIYSREIDRRLLDIQGKLDSKVDATKHWFDKRSAKRQFLMSFWAIPINSIFIPKIHRISAMRLPFDTIPVVFRDGARFDACIPSFNPLQWTPLVRGTRGITNRGASKVEAKIFESGECELEWFFYDEGDRAESILMNWAAGFFAQALLMLKRIQRAALISEVEYRTRFLLAVGGKSFMLQSFTDRGFPEDGWGRIDIGHYPLPAMQISTSANFSEICQLFENDLINLAANDRNDPPPEFDFAPALQRIESDFIDPAH